MKQEIAIDEQTTSQMMAAPAFQQALKLSEIWREESADVELRSLDGSRFFVHKANLIGASKTFADMFDSEKKLSDYHCGRLVVELQEPSAILDVILPYCYPRQLENWKLKLPEDLKPLAAFDKYQIWRGIDAFQAAFRQLVQDARTGGALTVPDPVDQFADTVAFGRYFKFVDLEVEAFRFSLEACALFSTPATELAILRITDFHFFPTDAITLVGQVADHLLEALNLYTSATASLVQQFAVHHPSQSCPSRTDEARKYWHAMRQCPTSGCVQRYPVQLTCLLCAKLVVDYKAFLVSALQKMEHSRGL